MLLVSLKPRKGCDEKALIAVKWLGTEGKKWANISKDTDEHGNALKCQEFL